MSFTTSDLKTIEYDRATRDFRAEFDGNVIGYFSCYSAAEEALNDYVLGLCQDGLIDAPLGVLNAVPEGTDEDDFSDCPAGPGEPKYKHTCDYHRDALGRCTMCLTDEAERLYHRLLSERDRWPIRSSIRAGFEPLLDKAHRRVIRRIRLQGSAISWTDGEAPEYKDGCAPVVARAAVIATALVLAAFAWS